MSCQYSASPSRLQIGFEGATGTKRSIEARCVIHAGPTERTAAPGGSPDPEPGLRLRPRGVPTVNTALDVYVNRGGELTLRLCRRYRALLARCEPLGPVSMTPGDTLNEPSEMFS
ncbi:hypothetical protein EYF80_028888 [Liparis tanakae]|uniref:Uncharacterized protein n=1 Tax=Liparis tanakae TaxID=230148 RepID=A0A4Z2H7A3_9TELE|nr:hypothetical protein EYF80_028888 [Liparis tanakae]